MKVWELGEFGLIDLIAEIVGRPLRDGVLLGIGDDASVWKSSGADQIGTTDVLVQDVHFTFKTAAWRDLGWKSLAINISDIAAMGGVPAYALVSLGLPPETEVDDVAEFYRGLLELASGFDVAVCGGNVSRSPVVFISLSVIGEAANGVLVRSKARHGDAIAVTGYLGQAAAGLRMLLTGLEFDYETTTALKKAHQHPYPRVAEGQALVRSGVKAAMDISDGLMGDLGHICRASRVGARIRAGSIPVHPLVRAAFKDESLALAVSGGEDYELLFTAGSEVMEKVAGLLETPVTVIGEIVSDDSAQVTLLDESGEPLAWEQAGWDHFSTSLR